MNQRKGARALDFHGAGGWQQSRSCFINAYSQRVLAFGGKPQPVEARPGGEMGIDDRAWQQPQTRFDVESSASGHEPVCKAIRRLAFDDDRRSPDHGSSARAPNHTAGAPTSSDIRDEGLEPRD